MAVVGYRHPRFPGMEVDLSYTITSSGTTTTSTFRAYVPGVIRIEHPSAIDIGYQLGQQIRAMGPFEIEGTSELLSGSMEIEITPPSRYKRRSLIDDRPRYKEGGSSSRSKMFEGIEVPIETRITGPAGRFIRGEDDDEDDARERLAARLEAVTADFEGRPNTSEVRAELARLVADEINKSGVDMTASIEVTSPTSLLITEDGIPLEGPIDIDDLDPEDFPDDGFVLDDEDEDDTEPDSFDGIDRGVLMERELQDSLGSPVVNKVWKWLQRGTVSQSQLSPIERAAIDQLCDWCLAHSLWTSPDRKTKPALVYQLTDEGEQITQLQTGMITASEADGP